MSSIRLIHWHAAEARERAARLRALGYQVNAAVPAPLTPRKALRLGPRPTHFPIPPIALLPAPLDI